MTSRAYFCFTSSENGNFIIGKHLFSNHNAIIMVRLIFDTISFHLFIYHKNMACQKKTTKPTEWPTFITIQNYIVTVAVFTACTLRFPPQEKTHVVSTRHQVEITFQKWKNLLISEHALPSNRNILKLLHGNRVFFSHLEFLSYLVMQRINSFLNI